MTQYLPAIVAVIAGISAIVAAVITWRLKNSSDERAREISVEKERRDEIKQLYTNVFVLFEQAMRQVSNRETFSLSREFSEATARIHLLAPEEIVSQYVKAIHSFEEWSVLHAKASPRQLDMGGHVVTVLQAPDPTAPFKEPANTAYLDLQERLKQLIGAMRAQLNLDA